MSSEGSVRAPRQARSRRTLERLVESALEIIEAEGAGAATVQRIVERAGSSVGSFYARFSGKEDLLDFLDARIWSDASDRFREAVAGRSWEEIPLASVVEGVVRLLMNAHRTRLSYRRSMGLADSGGSAFAEFRERVLDGVTEIVLTRSRDIEHPRPALAARVGALAVAGAVELAGDVHASPGGADELITELAGLYLAYLGLAPDPTTGDPVTVDFFNIWD